MAPPSKEIGKIPCSRIVRFLNSNEAAGFSSPNQDQVPPKRGRPKLVRKEPTVAAPLNPAGKEHGKSRRPRELDHTPFFNKRATEVSAPNKGWAALILRI
jgi:hypothetical protein